MYTVQCICTDSAVQCTVYMFKCTVYGNKLIRRAICESLKIQFVKLQNTGSGSKVNKFGPYVFFPK